MKKICFVASIPFAVNVFLKENIQRSSKIWIVDVVTNNQNVELLSDLNNKIINVNFKRKPAIIEDIHSLFRLIILFYSKKYCLVHSITPKAGFLTILAGYLTRIPIRIHTFTGQVWSTKTGFIRFILKMFDKIIVILSTHILVDSPSQLKFLISEGIIPVHKGIIFGKGSICGVDLKRFHPNSCTKYLLRKKMGISQDHLVILYIGRVNREKGIIDLSIVFNKVASLKNNVVMVIVGNEEDVSFSQIKNICSEHSDRLHLVKFSQCPEQYMAMADILCLPSYREGFGQVIIEAAACEVPAVATDIYGIRDALEEGITGLLFSLGSIELLEKNLLKLLSDDKLRHQMGKNARSRVKKYFSSNEIVYKTVNFYKTLINLNK